MGPGGRFLVVGLAVAAGEIALAALLAGTVLAPYFLGCAGASAALAVAGRRLVEPPRRPDDGPPGGEGGDPDPQPPWWPEFEADLRRYERERRSLRV